MKQTRWASEQAELAKKVQSLSEYIQVEEDPLEVLTAIRDLREMLRSLEDCAAREAKSNGATWQIIGDSLGTTRQAAQERYSVSKLPEKEYRQLLKRIDERRAANAR